MLTSGYRIIKFCCLKTRTCKTMSTIEYAKEVAAACAIDNHVLNNCVLGIGSGSTITYAVKRLSERVKVENLNVACVASSFQAKQLVVNYGLHLVDLDICPKIDCYIDGADEIDQNLTLIKGGGGCLLQEKILASCSREVIIIADWTKNSFKLGDHYKKGIPIEVLPSAYIPIQQRLIRCFKGSFNLRNAVSKAGPCITDNGNFILDWTDFEQDLDWGIVQREIKQIPGVIESGIFYKMAHRVYFGNNDGTILEKII